MKIPILLYHSVAAPDGDDIRPRGYWLPPELFEKHLLLLKEKGYVTISLGLFRRALSENSRLPDKSIILTFDDGYLNNYTLVLPRLIDFGFTATFFPTVSTIGRSGMMGTGELEKLLEKGMEVGSHGMKHEILGGRKEEELRRELIDSKRVLEGALKTEVDYFSLPRGYLPRILPRLVRESGYRGMCTSEPGYNSPATDPFRWRRFSVRSGFEVEPLGAILGQRGPLLRRMYLVEKLKARLRFRYRWKLFRWRR